MAPAKMAQPQKVCSALPAPAANPSSSQIPRRTAGPTSSQKSRRVSPPPSACAADSRSRRVSPTRAETAPSRSRESAPTPPVNRAFAEGPTQIPHAASPFKKRPAQIPPSPASKKSRPISQHLATTSAHPATTSAQRSSPPVPPTPAAAQGSAAPEITRDPTPAAAAEQGRAGKSKYYAYLDAEDLNCSLCVEPLAPPVFQCHNGHTMCQACLIKYRSNTCPTCSRRIGSQRCNALEKLLESCWIKCRQCKEKLKFTERADHEKEVCKSRPYRCPLKHCMHEGMKRALLPHLEREHGVVTVELNKDHREVDFTMKCQDECIVVVKSSSARQDVGPLEDVLLVHHEVKEGLGDIFFCTLLQGSVEKFYCLSVKFVNEGSSRSYDSWHMMQGSALPDFRDSRKDWTKDFSLIPHSAQVHEHSGPTCNCRYYLHISEHFEQPTN